MSRRTGRAWGIGLVLCLIQSGCTGWGEIDRAVELPWASSGRLLPIEGRWTLIRLEEDGTIPIGEKRVTVRALVDDAKWLLRSLSQGEGPNPLYQLSRLEESLDPWPVIIETSAWTDVLKLLELVKELVSSGPPYAINVFLKVRTTEGKRCIGIPVLFYYKYPLRKHGLAHAKAVDDARPFDWYFFCENQVVGYDHNPVPSPDWSHRIGELWISPLDSRAFLVWADESGFDLVTRSVGSTEAALNMGYEERLPLLFRYRSGSEWRRERVATLMLSGTPEGVEERRKRLEERRPFEGTIARFMGGWTVVPSWDYVEELAARMTGPARENPFTNLIVRYALYKNSPRQTVQDFVRILELSKRYGAKGVFTDLPRGD